MEGYCSKRYEKQGDSTLMDEFETYSDEKYDDMDFSDTRLLRPFKKFVRYARDKEIVQGIGIFWISIGE